MIGWFRRKRPEQIRTDESRRALETTLQQKQEVDKLVFELRARRVRNNFSPALEAALSLDRKKG